MPRYKKRKDGRYASSVSINGKRHYFYGSTIKELENKKIEFINNIKFGETMSNSKMFFKDYKLIWFDSKKELLAPKTVAMYKSILKSHCDSIDFKILTTINKTDIQYIMNSLKNNPNMAKKVLMTLKQIFDSAIDDDLIKKNPCKAKSIQIPKNRTINDKRILNKNELYLCEATDFTDRERMFVYLSLYCGLRPEETRALTKNDFVFNDNYNYIKINKTVVYTSNQPILQNFTKNRASTREVPLFDKTVPFIKSFLSNLADDIIFTNISDKSNYMTKQGYDWLINKIKEKMYLKSLELNLEFDKKNFTPYIFRHTYATMLYYSGTKLIDAMYYMGHSDSKMLQEVYIHLDQQKLRNNEQINIFINDKLNSIKNKMSQNN